MKKLEQINKLIEFAKENLTDSYEIFGQFLIADEMVDKVNIDKKTKELFEAGKDDFAKKTLETIAKLNMDIIDLTKLKLKYQIIEGDDAEEEVS